MSCNNTKQIYNKTHQMIIYEVLVEVQAGLIEEFESFMRRRHIFDLLATGCFLDARIEDTGTGRYRISYRSKERADLDNYLENHARRLREDFVTLFPNGIDVSRNIIEQ